VGRGLKVVIAGAGGAAHLPGMVASLTTLPVIGVPVQSRALSGVDSLHSIVQMPAGIPVATVAIGNGVNAGLLAVQILATADAGLAEQLLAYRRDLEAIAATVADDQWRGNRQIDDRGGLDAAMTGVEDGAELITQTVADLLAIGQRQLITGQQQCRTHQRLTQFGQQHQWHGMVGHPDTDGAPLGVLQHFGRLARGFQQKSIGTRRACLEDAKLRRVDTGIAGDLTEIAAHEGEVMVFVGLADASHPLQRLTVTDPATQRVAGICGVGDQLACAHHLNSLVHQPGLRIARVNFEVLHH
jgi:hypothetical protein